MTTISSSNTPPRNAPSSPPQPLRLLQVLGYAGAAGRLYGITGVEKVVQLLLEGLDPQAFEHYLAYPGIGSMSETYGRHARAICAVEPRRRFDRAYIAALSRFIQEHGVDVVVSHGLRYDFLTSFACRGTRVPHVIVRAVALADEPMPAQTKLLFGVFDSWSMHRCDSIVAVSHASKQRMVRTQRLPASKITVIPNGVRMPAVSEAARAAARRELGLAPQEQVIGGVGQLIGRKSFDVLVEALGRMRGRFPHTVGVVLGEGPERGRLEDLARSLGVRLVLPGFVPEPYAYMAAFDVAVLPSQAEGMPLVVLEAMALGVANVATPAAGTAELLEDGVSGVWIPRGDASALAESLQRLLEDPDLRRRIAEAGYRRVRENYSLESMLQRFTDHLRATAGWSSS